MPPKTKQKRKYGTVSLPIQLIEKIKKQIQGTGFTSLSSFVEYVMRSVVEERARETNQKAKERKSFTNKEKEKIKSKLKTLGYI